VPLAEEFLSEISSETGEPPKALSTAACKKVTGYAWPGNVRELKNAIEKAALLSTTRTIEEWDLELNDETEARVPQTCQEAVDAAERNYLNRVLSLHNGNVTEAARAAAINRTDFYRRLRKHRITARNFRAPEEPRSNRLN
jgi:DNA-binding NtrC family response regulator